MNHRNVQALRRDLLSNMANQSRYASLYIEEELQQAMQGVVWRSQNVATDRPA